MDITQVNALQSVPAAITAEVVPEEQKPSTQFSPAQQLFFRDLHNMLMKESSKGCVKWLDGLNGFLILDKDRFLEDIMTRYFGDAKYASFTRRLKRWGFNRISKGPNSGGYYHDTFHRNMSFDDYDDLESDISCSESSQVLPPKKRMSWSPPIQADSIIRHSNDVNVMPELMREINRNKRFENVDYGETPAAKRARFGNEFYGNSINGGFTSMSGNSGNGFASMPNSDYQMFRNSMRQDHLEYLQRLKRQVFMENHQGGLNSMASSQPRASVPNDILKREMDLRRMQQALACQQNSNQMYNHSSNGSNPAMSRSGGVSAAACFDDQDRSEEDAVRALGAMKSTNGYDMHPSAQQGYCQFQGLHSHKQRELRKNYPADSTVPIPGLSEMMEPESPFNRAA
eukprot:scaffold347037_cov76-Cyclotella_meneghiniana.AAC.2